MDASSVTVDITPGRLRGTVENGVTAFLGVPYAAPLSGQDWFLPAQPVPGWDGVRDATAFGATVPKPGYQGPVARILTAEPDFPGPECLNLNVWTPATDGSAPVFVWIHGGAFRNGSGRSGYYNGSAFARDGVVCVSINYRLGAYGFLDTGDEHTNIGLRDQIAALEWVRDHIAAFGGDPSRVTVAGESAGGMSVGSLLSSPRAAGLFSQAVLQSGAGHHALTRPTAQAVTAALAERLGIPPTREAFAGVAADDLIAASSALDIEVQQNPDPARWGEITTNVMLFEPVIGDDVLPRLPIDGIRDGAGDGVRILVGSNAEEMLFFLAPGGVVDLMPPEAALGIAAGYGLPDPAAAAAVYRDGDADLPGGQLVSRIMTDWFFRIPAVRLAETRPGLAYVYRFDHRSTALDGALGACHAVELPFAFDALGADGVEALTGPNPPQVLADEMHSAWVRFTRDGDPGWPAYGAARSVRVFGDGAEGTVIDDLDGATRVLWEGVR
ncbi:carboxylesterase/lipase family protein [Tsukamurella sp. 1534]|uniref:carboxylesterase/lipase family protein n=1 Tax=Tsukamurella sp. 1534 TaxID=1151061 RepID=UPI0002E6093A|nr:carboxylesterase family protein [Tsukamurella sp. 1534]